MTTTRRGGGGGGEKRGADAGTRRPKLHSSHAAGGAAGPWATGFLFDRYSSYTLAFAIGIAVSALSAFAIWQASPRKIRAVAGQLHKVQGAA